MRLDGCVSVDAFRFLACCAVLRAVGLEAGHLLAGGAGHRPQAVSALVEDVQLGRHTHQDRAVPAEYRGSGPAASLRGPGGWFRSGWTCSWPACGADADRGGPHREPLGGPWRTLVRRSCPTEEGPTRSGRSCAGRPDRQPAQQARPLTATGTATGTHPSAHRRTLTDHWFLPHLRKRRRERSASHTYYVLAGATPVLVHNCNEAIAAQLKSRVDDLHGLLPKGAQGRRSTAIFGQSTTREIRLMWLAGALASVIQTEFWTG